MEGSKEKEHMLALKVMRLTKPTLMPYHPLISNPRDITHTLAELTAQSDIARTKNLDYFGVSNLLTLPQNFGLISYKFSNFIGTQTPHQKLLICDTSHVPLLPSMLQFLNIFLGETFSSYISVHNDSQQKCTEIVLKIDLQTSSQRLMLSGVNLNPATELNPNQSIDDVIHHEVKELGTHILVCAVSYTAQQGEKMAFRKFFKFQVLKPLDVKTKFYNAESDDVYLEAQIQNITQGPIYMDHVSLEASSQYQARELNTSQGKQGSDVVFGKVDYLNPNDIRQYLYCLCPQPELYNDSHILKGVTNIGKLDIVWKTNMGEKGRLQTSQLQRVAPGYGDIRVTVEEVPDTVPMETTFRVVCRITNCCERSMDLTLVLQNNNSSGLLWCGLSGKKLGNLPKNDHIDLPLTMITTAPGLQTISGLRLIDNFLKRTYEHDELAQVFVCNDDSS